MRKPTTTRAGAVAKEGMARKMGERKRDRPKRAAEKRPVRPVRPPSAIPAALSAKVVTVEVPSTAPAAVPTASERRAHFSRGSLPFSSSRSDWAAMPMMPPRVSKRSTKRKAKTTRAKSGVSSWEKSICPRVGIRLGTPKPPEKSGMRLPFTDGS